MPSPSFANRGHAYSAHTIFPCRVAEYLLLGRAAKLKSNRPVYLSRSRLSTSGTGRVIRNEPEFEEWLSSCGALICRPETMSLEQQVFMFNNYTTFIGCWGSAFHNLMFCRELCGVTLHILSGWGMNPNYFLFDAILGLESHYINCLRPTPGAPQPGPTPHRDPRWFEHPWYKYSMIDMDIDIGLMRSYLAENQII